MLQAKRTSTAWQRAFKAKTTWQTAIKCIAPINAWEMRETRLEELLGRKFHFRWLCFSVSKKYEWKIASENISHAKRTTVQKHENKTKYASSRNTKISQKKLSKSLKMASGTHRLDWKILRNIFHFTGFSGKNGDRVLARSWKTLEFEDEIREALKCTSHTITFNLNLSRKQEMRDSLFLWSGERKPTGTVFGRSMSAHSTIRRQFWRKVSQPRWLLQHSWDSDERWMV